jgi:aminopeptidase-like protein
MNSSPKPITTGETLHAFASRLYPVCRSITGHGVRQTLALIGSQIPLNIHEVPTGSVVYDWEVPLEWNIEDAALMTPEGERVVDFHQHNLHVVSYSEPVAKTMALEELETRLHSLPQAPSWIPYRTSYYQRSWGFCLRHDTRQSLLPGQYRVEIKSSLAPGSLTYGELAIRGRLRDEILFFTHICHPSLANDNASGMAITTALARWVAEEPRRYSYRFVFAPGTIGSLCWLKRNERKLGHVRGGLTLGLLGDPASLTYKMSRDGATLTDTVASYAFQQIDRGASIVPFSPYGYDERQFCSPGFNLPIGRLTRSVNGGYPQYHSSADDLTLIRPEFLEQSLAACQLFVRMLEENRRYVNQRPKGEPQLGKRGLYGTIGGVQPAESQHAMLWVLNQSDGSKSLLDIARRSGLRFDVIRDAATALERAGLLRNDASQPPTQQSITPRGPRQRSKARKVRREPVARPRTVSRRKGAKP